MKDDVFTINPNQGGVAKFKKISKAISNYVVRNYDSGILLAKGIQEGKLPTVALPITPSNLPRKKKDKVKRKRKRGKNRQKHRKGKKRQKQRRRKIR